MKCSCGQVKDTAKQLITCPVCNEEIMAFTAEECVWDKFKGHLDEKHADLDIEAFRSAFHKVKPTRYNRHFAFVDGSECKVSHEATIQMLGYLPVEKFIDGLRNHRLTVYEAFYIVAEMDNLWNGGMVEELMAWLEENPQAEPLEGHP
jgi:hypothetical protein